jgi:NADPH:quinone reductase-like Zn-dependent oxidoreductase
MKAYVLKGFDEPPGYQDVPEPVLGPADLLVRVQATSVNPVDWLVREGFFRSVQEYRFPAVFGRDLSGVVERVGPEVTRYRPGDRVFGFVKREHIGDGTFAELVAVPQDHFVTATPGSVTTAVAGVLGLSGVTALECVDAVEAGPGGVVLVNGAAGGVGSFAVQFAVASGATVVATARPGPQADHVRALGAAEVVDWTQADLVASVRRVAPGGVDGFVDLVRHSPSMTIGVGEDEAHAQVARLCQGLLRPGGRAASVTNGGVPELLGGITCVNVHSTPSPASFDRLAALVRSGAVVAPIHETFGFDQLPAAFACLQAGQVLGKISVVH